MKQRGFSLVELMVAIGIASMLSLGVISFFLSQTQSINKMAGKDDAAIESNQSFEVISRLLRHANKQDIEISSAVLNEGVNAKPEINNDRLKLSFSLPKGFPIWPNDRPPYDNNWIQISWSNDSSELNPYAIHLANAESKVALDSAQKHVLFGSSSSTANTLIANLDLWPLNASGQPQSSIQAKADGGYLLRITSRAGQPATGYNNPGFDPANPLSRYRTYTVNGIIAPRN